MRSHSTAGAPSSGHLKHFWHGTHRTVAPEVTLRRLQPLLGKVGITRVGVTTGLDTIGLPVATAVRPNGRALSVAQGKGVTVTAAKVSAIMEAAEAYHAETVTGPLHRARFDELDGTVDPMRLPLAASVKADDRLDARYLWIAGEDLPSGQQRFVPYELVHADYTLPLAEQPRFQATTSGLAAGNEIVEAQLHALYEAIERDAIACWRAAGGPGGSKPRPLDLGGIDDVETRALLERLEAASIDVAAWDVSSDIQIPVALALLVPRDGAMTGVEAEVGSGCHLDPRVALSRAVTEAAQTRLTRIAGARDDFEPTSYGTEARRRRRVEAAEWRVLGRRGVVGWAAFEDRFPAGPADDLDVDLTTVLEALAEVGCHEAVWVDLTQAEVGLPVGRVIVPGLEGPFLPDLYRPGERALARSA